MFAPSAIRQSFVGMADISTLLQIYVFRPVASEDGWWNTIFIDISADIARTIITDCHAKSDSARA
jgi:hypothetical protein